MLLKVLLKTLNTNVILYVSQNISILIPEISDILEDKGFRQPMEDQLTKISYIGTLFISIGFWIIQGLV
jgi:hypothetical protein